MDTPRLLPGLLLALCLVTHSTAADRSLPSKSVWDQVDRTITKEPTYSAKPRYALLVLGENAESRMWMVEDDRVLYLDQNGNGDLTDDGPPLTPSNERSLGDGGWEFEYVLAELNVPNGAKHKDFRLRRWKYGDSSESYGLSLTLNGTIPMYAGWQAFWSSSAKRARLIHFGGQLEPHLLRQRVFTHGPNTTRLSIAFVSPGAGIGADSRLSTEAIPENVVPEVLIDWPVPDGAAPIQTSHRLLNRCCYWEYYTLGFQVPAGAATGRAHVTVVLPDFASPIAFRTQELDVPVRPQKTSNNR